MLDNSSIAYASGHLIPSLHDSSVPSEVSNPFSPAYITEQFVALTPDSADHFLRLSKYEEEWVAPDFISYACGTDES